MSLTITTPRGEIMINNGTAKLVWNPDFGRQRTAGFNRAQVIIDNEIIKRIDKYVPLRTGMLKTSAILGTTPGTGRIRYIAPYSARQYYKTAKSRSYDPLRGAYWFERMKAAEKAQILRVARKAIGARS